MKDLGERETVLLAERDVQPVFGGCGLQLEIKRAAEALAQRQPPGSVDAAAERRVDDELHSAAFVEEPLGDDGLLAGHCAEDFAPLDNVFGQLFGAGVIERAFLLQPGDGFGYIRGAGGQGVHFFAQVRNLA